jgi:hypothetical protein
LASISASGPITKRPMFVKLSPFTTKARRHEESVTSTFSASSGPRLEPKIKKLIYHYNSSIIIIKII